MKSKSPIKFRAVLVEGIVGGGGGIRFGEWREDYAQARADLRSDKFKPSYGDFHALIEADKQTGNA